MKAGVIVGACLVLAAAVLIVLKGIRTDTTALLPSETANTDESTEQSVRIDRITPETVGEPVSDESGITPSSAEERIDNQLARRTEEMADAIFALAGSQIVQMLTESGLAPSDSEGIARQYAVDVAACAIAALSAEASRQSISIDELISQVSAAAANGSSPFDVIDRSAMEAYAAPCEADALQRAGISFPTAAQQLSDEQLAHLNECVASYSNSDITDRVTILEICGQELFED